MIRENKKARNFRLNYYTIILLEKISMLENNTITNSLEIAILEKAEKLNIKITDQEIEQKINFYKNKNL